MLYFNAIYECRAACIKKKAAVNNRLPLPVLIY